MEEHEAKVKALQQALADGESSGYLESLDPDAFLERLLNKLAR